MTLHRRGKPFSTAYARRKLAEVEAQLAAWKATDCTGDWRKACDKRRATDALDAEWMRWDRVLRPTPIEVYRLPF